MIGWHHIYKSRLATPCSQSLKRVRVLKGHRCGGSQIEGSPEARTERARPPAEPTDDDGPRRKGGYSVTFKEMVNVFHPPTFLSAILPLRLLSIQ